MKALRSSALAVFLTVVSLVLAACGGGGPSPGTNNAKPILTTQGVDNVSPYQAHYNGLANPNGNAGKAYFQRSTDPGMANATDLLPKKDLGGGVTAVAVDYWDNTVAPATRYYLWLVYDVAGEKTFSNIVSYTTGSPAALPTAQTWAPSNVTTSGFQGNGSVNTQGLAGEWWMDEALDNTYANPTSTTPQSLPASLTSVTVSYAVSGMAPNTSRYYRVVCRTSAGTTYGLWVKATTNPLLLPATVVTLGATNLSQTGGRLNGTVNPHGLAGTGWQEWTLDATHATFTATTPISVGSGNTDVAVTFDLTGQAPGTTIHYRTAGNTSAAGTIRGSWTSFTTSLGNAPLITGLTVGTPSGDNVSVSLTVDPVDPYATTDAYLETSPDNNVWTPTAHQMVNPGSLVTLTFPLTSLPAGDTYIRGRASNSWGADTWQKGDKVTIVSGNITIIGNPHPLDSYIIFCNDQEVYRADGVPFNYQGPPGDYKFIDIPLAYAAAGKPYAVVDLLGNNLFRIAAGGVLDFGTPQSGADGRGVFNVSGSGFTPLYQAPVNIGGVVQTHAVVDESTNNNVPVGATQDVTETLSQTGFLVTKFDSGLGTIYGTVNGDLVYFWFWGGPDPIWLKTWRETWIFNSAGTAFTGDGKETWLARSGGAFYYVHWNSSGTH